ncbi:MAG: acyl carrier protein [Pseudomonadota bacterium]
MATEQEIIEVVAEAFSVDASDLTPESSRDDVEDWDSMGMLMLMAEFDERYGLVVEEETLAELHTVADIIKLVQTKGDVAA